MFHKPSYMSNYPEELKKYQTPQILCLIYRVSISRCRVSRAFVTSIPGGGHSGSPSLVRSLCFGNLFGLELWSSLSTNIPRVCVYVPPVYNTFCSIYLFSPISTKTTASKNQNIKKKLPSYFYFFPMYEIQRCFSVLFCFVFLYVSLPPLWTLCIKISSSFLYSAYCCSSHMLWKSCHSSLNRY